MPGRIADAIGRAPRDLRGGHVHLVRECAQCRVVYHPLEELRILASVSGLFLKEKIVQPDGRAAEGVGLNQVRPGLEILGVNFLDDFWLGQKQEFVAALEVFPFPVREAGAAEILLTQLVALHHRAHGAIEHDDALAHERLERVQDFCGHGSGTLRERRGISKKQIYAS